MRDNVMTDIGLSIQSAGHTIAAALYALAIAVVIHAVASILSKGK